MANPFQVVASIVTGTASSRPVTVVNATATGDTLLVVVVVNNTTCTVSACTDSQGNVYTLDKSFTTTQPTVYAFRSPGATGGSGGGATAALSTTDTVTITTAAVSGNVEIYVTDAPGVGAVDQIANIATGSSATPSVSATPTANNETCVSYFGTANAGGSPTVNSPFTSLGSFSTGSNPFTAMAYDVLTGGSGVAQTSTETIVSANWRAGMWTFQPGSGGVSGSGGLALGALGFSGSGAVGVSGSGGLGLGPLGFAGSGATGVSGSGGLALGPLGFSGAGGPKNLIASIAPAAGSDSFGNSYFRGVVSYGSVNFTQLDGGVVVLGPKAGGGPAILPSVTNSTTDLILNSGSSGSNGSLITVRETTGVLIETQAGPPASPLLDVAGNVLLEAAVNAVGGTVSNPTLIKTDTWNDTGGLTNGWGKGTGFFKYRLNPDGSVDIAAKDLNCTGATNIDGTTILAAANGLPAAYRPSTNKRIVCWVDVLRQPSAGVFEAACLLFVSDGSVQCFGIAAAATSVSCYGKLFIDI